MSNEEITNKIYCPISFDEKLIGKDSIYFTVPGKPVAKQRPKAARKGRFFTVYTPNETKINKIGIEPDYEVELDDEVEGDEQLNKAIELLK